MITLESRHERQADAGEALLYGVPAIARYLGLRPRVVEHLIASGRLPVMKLGRKSAIRRDTLRAWLDTQERRAVPADAP